MAEKTNKVGIPIGRSLTNEEYRQAMLKAKKTAKAKALKK